MGLGSFIKQGVGEMMIARPDAAKHLIIYKHRDETVPWGSQLTVDSDEGCVFFRDGQTHGILPPGRHTLKSQNIPFLSNFMDSFTGGNLFKAEVFFVRTQPIRNAPAKFGGALDGMTDPGTGMSCSPRVFGEFVVRVLDPIKFIIGLVGQGVAPDSNEQILRYVGDRMMMGVEQALVDVCNANATSILNISSQKLALQKAFMQSAPSLDEVGLQLTELIKFNVSLNPDEKKELREAWNMVGKAKREAMAAQFKIDQKVQERQAYVQMAQQNPGYMQYAQAEAMIGAGQGMAKGGADANVAGLGAQMAVGMGMAGAMQQPWMQPAPQYQHVPSPPGGMITCGSCGAQSPGGKFCANCGSPLAPPAPPQPQGGFCQNCGAQLGGGKFCAQCGTPVAGPPQAAPQGYPPAQGAPQGYPPAQGGPPQGYPPAQGAPPQGYPPAQGAPQGYPPAQGAPPQGYPPAQGAPPQGYPPAQGAPPQGYPPAQGAPPQGAPPQGYPPAPQGGPPGGSYSGGGPGQGGGQPG